MTDPAQPSTDAVERDIEWVEKFGRSELTTPEENDIIQRVIKFARDALTRPSPGERERVIEECARVADGEYNLRIAHMRAAKGAGNKKEVRDFETMAIAHSQTAGAIRALKSCSTCGAKHPNDNEFCSNGFHARTPKTPAAIGVDEREDWLVVLMMNELHSHVTEMERPNSLSDLSDAQTDRARNAIRAIIAALAPADREEIARDGWRPLPAPPSDDILALAAGGKK